MNKSNIILIGMPGAGKSTIGVLLAKATRMPFIDSDLLIQQREAALLQEIINTSGLDRFLKIEEEAIISLDIENYIIATGGSVVYSTRGIAHLKQIGYLVYLKVSYKKIETRIRNITTRGIALKEGSTLYDMYRERVPLYEKCADIIIDCSGKHIEQIVAEIMSTALPKIRLK